MKRANKSKRPKIVALLGNQLHHKNSLSIYLKGNLNIVGAVYCNSKTNGLPLEYIKIRIRKIGFFKVLSQIISRIIYLARNRSFDKNLYHQIFCESDIKEIIRSFNIPVKNCSSYSQSEVITWIKGLMSNPKTADDVVKAGNKAVVMAKSNIPFQSSIDDLYNKLLNLNNEIQDESVTIYKKYIHMYIILYIILYI